MAGQLELFNLLTVVFLIGGIVFAGIALFVFLRSGIREYFAITHHDVNKDIEKELKGTKKEEDPSSEDHSTESPSEFLRGPEDSGDEEPVEETENIRHAEVIDPEDGSGETTATSVEEGSEETTSMNNEVEYEIEDDDDGSGETTAMDDGSGETTAISREPEEPTAAGDGTGHTEDLGKPSTIREDQKGIKREEDEEEDALTGVLDNDAAETAVLNAGDDDTSTLDAQRAKRIRKNTIRDDTLWGAPLSNNQMTDAHNIVMVNTDRKVDSVPNKEGEE